MTFNCQLSSITPWCCVDSKAFSFEMKCCKNMFGKEGQTESLVCRTSVMERFPDRPVQFNSKASKAALQTCSAWLDVLKSLCCSYVVWQIAFFSTVQLIFLSLYLVFIPAPLLNWMLNYTVFTLLYKFKNSRVDDCSFKYVELTLHVYWKIKLSKNKWYWRCSPYPRGIATTGV